jgi:hypothetical protein
MMPRLRDVADANAEFCGASSEPTGADTTAPSEPPFDREKAARTAELVLQARNRVRALLERPALVGGHGLFNDPAAMVKELTLEKLEIDAALAAMTETTWR